MHAHLMQSHNKTHQHRSVFARDALAEVSFSKRTHIFFYQSISTSKMIVVEFSIFNYGKLGMPSNQNWFGTKKFLFLRWTIIEHEMPHASMHPSSYYTERILDERCTSVSWEKNARVMVSVCIRGPSTFAPTKSACRSSLNETRPILTPDIETTSISGVLSCCGTQSSKYILVVLHITKCTLVSLDRWLFLCLLRKQQVFYAHATLVLFYI